QPRGLSARLRPSRNRLGRRGREVPAAGATLGAGPGKGRGQPRGGARLRHRQNRIGAHPPVAVTAPPNVALARGQGYGMTTQVQSGVQAPPQVALSDPSQTSVPSRTPLPHKGRPSVSRDCSESFRTRIWPASGVVPTYSG